MMKNTNKDWTGSNKSGYLQLGSSNNSDTEREERDFYATDPRVVEELLKHEKFNQNIWENAAGMKHISNVLSNHGYIVRNSDIVDRTGDVEIYDFLDENNNDVWGGDIITNPPYKYALEFVRKSLDCVHDGAKVAMFLKIQFLEGKSRREFFDAGNNPKCIYVCSQRVACAKNGEFYEKDKKGNERMVGSAVCYAWYVWEKGYKGDTILKWIM